MEPFDDGGSWQSYKEAHGGKMPSAGPIHCPPAQQQMMNLSRSWLGLNCLRPMEHSDGIFVAGIDIAADSNDPAYIHDKDDEVQAYVKDRATDVYQFLQVPYESVMLGMLSIHWSRQSIIPKLMAIHISWSRDGVHFERPEHNTGASFPETPRLRVRRAGLCRGRPGGYAFGKVPQGGPRSRIGLRWALS